ncbi:MAG: hypothetical protein Q9174_001719 [Haloplaca sp. 1 TL-2023]
MADVTETTRRQSAVQAKKKRRSSLSEKLNQFTNNTFHRRQSSIAVPSELARFQRTRSYIPTPSLGSRTSSLFGDLASKSTEVPHTYQSETRAVKESRAERSPQRREGCHSRLASASPFFFHVHDDSEALKLQDSLEQPPAEQKPFTHFQSRRRPTFTVQRHSLLAPIGPPLPQGFTSTSSLSPPSFARSTSSSIARQTKSLKPRKGPPPPLKMSGEQSTSMATGFKSHSKHALQTSFESQSLNNQQDSGPAQKITKATAHLRSRGVARRSGQQDHEILEDILGGLRPDVPPIPSRFLGSATPWPSSPSPHQVQPPVARRLNYAQSSGNLRRPAAANEAATSSGQLAPLPSRRVRPKRSVRFEEPADDALAVGPLVTGPRATQGVSDPTIIRGKQDRSWWAGRVSGINDRLLAADDSLTATDRHNHALHELHHKCMDKAARESLALFGRAWHGGWSVEGLEACQADAEALPAVVRKREKLAEAVGRIFGGRKPKQ